MSSNEDISIPPMNKIYLIGIWMETVIYGLNCVIYGLSMYVLLRKRNSAESSWMLPATSTLLFVLCTVYVAASLRQLLEAFIYVPPSAPPNYSSLYWLDETSPMAALKDFLYVCLVFLQDIILIWRLYVVWCRNWKIIVLPILVEATHISCAYAASALLMKPGAVLYGSMLARLGLTGWSLDIVVNISVTLAIAGRLWWMGRRVSSVSSISSGVSNRYLATIYTVIESGGLFAAVTIVMMALYVRGSPLALTGIDIASQLAVLTPLLIVVRIGLGLTHGLPRAYEEYTMTQKSMRLGSTFRVAISHEVELDNISDQSPALVGNHKNV